MKNIFTTLSFFILASLPGIFGAAKASAFLPQNFKADLIQEHKSSISGKVKTSHGKIVFQNPNQLRIEITKPQKTTFVSNRSMTWYYQAPRLKGSPGQLTVKKQGNSQLSRFFSLLKKGLNSNKLYKVIKAEQKYKLIFNKKTAQEIGFTEAQLIFAKTSNAEPVFKNLQSIEMTKLSKKKVLNRFENIVENTKVKADNFHFVVPPNTKVSNN